MEIAQNSFNGGLLMDMNDTVVPNTVLTDCLNGTIITFDGNEFILQNDSGNGRVESCALKKDFIPLGIKQYGGIIYIASMNPLTGECELGSFPSPERNISSEELSMDDIDTAILDSTLYPEGKSKGLQITYLKADFSLLQRMVLRPGDKFLIYITPSTGSSSINNFIETYKNEPNKNPLIDFLEATRICVVPSNLENKAFISRKRNKYFRILRNYIYDQTGFYLYSDKDDIIFNKIQNPLKNSLSNGKYYSEFKKISFFPRYYGTEYKKEKPKPNEDNSEQTITNIGIYYKTETEQNEMKTIIDFLKNQDLKNTNVFIMGAYFEKPESLNANKVIQTNLEKEFYSNISKFYLERNLPCFCQYFICEMGISTPTFQNIFGFSPKKSIPPAPTFGTTLPSGKSCNSISDL